MWHTLTIEKIEQRDDDWYMIGVGLDGSNRIIKRGELILEEEPVLLGDLPHAWTVTL